MGSSCREHCWVWRTWGHILKERAVVRQPATPPLGIGWSQWQSYDGKSVLEKTCEQIWNGHFKDYWCSLSKCFSQCAFIEHLLYSSWWESCSRKIYKKHNALPSYSLASRREKERWGWGERERERIICIIENNNCYGKKANQARVVRIRKKCVRNWEGTTNGLDEHKI